VLYRGAIGASEERLLRALDFFGIPSQPVEIAETAAGSDVTRLDRSTVFGSIDTFAEAVRVEGTRELLSTAAVWYAYACPERGVCASALASLSEQASWQVNPAPPTASVHITDAIPAFTGPMSGVTMTAHCLRTDYVLTRTGERDNTEQREIMSVNGAASFVSFRFRSVHVYFSASAEMIDIDAPVEGNYYDVKTQPISAMPLVMFLRWSFADVMWRPAEHGACLIIDDPLLKRRYGCCRFDRLLDQMRQYGFTTNIAFIPWNWWRTDVRQSKWFRQAGSYFSVSIHGCDHTAAEFGIAGRDALHAKSALAQVRMQSHRQRTSIEHDPIMVFPQGVFSSRCPEVLKHQGYMAAVNTEICASDHDSGRVAVRDVWDVAILKYSCFPVYTRRYPFHGVENFAFDRLLGKPTLIVVHHDHFRDGGAELLNFIERVTALQGSLRWRSLREVLARAYRFRSSNGLAECVMYANELAFENTDAAVSMLEVRKREPEDDAIATMRVDNRSVEWTRDGAEVVLRHAANKGATMVISVLFRPVQWLEHVPSVKYRLTVAARRVLSELRDESLRWRPRVV
jgi:hypothetical protein